MNNWPHVLSSRAWPENLQATHTARRERRRDPTRRRSAAARRGPASPRRAGGTLDLVSDAGLSGVAPTPMKSPSPTRATASASSCRCRTRRRRLGDAGAADSALDNEIALRAAAPSAPKHFLTHTTQSPTRPDRLEERPDPLAVLLDLPYLLHLVEYSFRRAAPRGAPPPPRRCQPPDAVCLRSKENFHAASSPAPPVERRRRLRLRSSELASIRGASVPAIAAYSPSGP